MCSSGCCLFWHQGAARARASADARTRAARAAAAGGCQKRALAASCAQAAVRPLSAFLRLRWGCRTRKAWAGTEAHAAGAAAPRKCHVRAGCSKAVVCRQYTARSRAFRRQLTSKNPIIQLSLIWCIEPFISYIPISQTFFCCLELSSKKGLHRESRQENQLQGTKIMQRVLFFN